MKLQLQANALRLRLDERELAELLAGKPLLLALQQQGMTLMELRVVLAPSLHFAAAGSAWRLQLPEAKLRAYVQTLPRRDALALPLPGGLSLDFEVDVRDSIRERGAKRRPDRTTTDG